MSLAGGDATSDPAHAQITSSLIEEDYCLHGADRFRHQCEQNGVFQPGVLQAYGIFGEPSLMRSIKQARLLSATFGTCFLGSFPQLATATTGLVSRDTETKVDCRHVPLSTPATSYESLPFNSLLLGPCPPAEVIANPHILDDVWRREVAGASDALHLPSQWCLIMNGVVTVPNWSTAAKRRRIVEQLQLAAFLGLRAVQVPLPCYAADLDWSGEEEAEEARTGDAQRTALPTITAEEENQRNIRIACLAADILLAFVHQSTHAKVWVRCDACNPSHRYQLQRLRQAVLYGFSSSKTDAGKTVYHMRLPGIIKGDGVRPSCDTAAHATSSTALEMSPPEMHPEAAASFQALLYFSSWSPRLLVSSEWLGEDVATFECPSASALLSCLAPHGVAPHEHPHYRAEAATEEPIGSAAEAPLSNAADHPLCFAKVEEDPQKYRDGSPGDTAAGGGAHPDPREESRSETLLSLTNYSLGDWCVPNEEERDRAGGEEEGPASDAGAEAAVHGHTRAEVMLQRYTYVMPDDLQPLISASWAGHYPPLMSVVTFLVELLRRRVMPIFDRSFFSQYPLLNYLYFKAVAEPTRDVFATFEGQLQLPLQPLTHKLSSGVYEVFERDAPKYRQYRAAIYHYVQDWVNAGAERQHAAQNEIFVAQHSVVPTMPASFSEERVLYLVLLGCGRGPLIDECLNAASALGVRLRIFAIEQNPPAAAFTRMRWAADPEWTQLARLFGHSLDVVVADGRTIATTAGDGVLPQLPYDFGLCDLIVSELLGSLGDNELSPECLEDFHIQLRQIQRRRGVKPNPFLTSIPQQYTAWVAPLMSAPLEAALAEVAMKGLTVPPPGCPDRHAAITHSLLVTNLSRAIMLAPPQPCWTFQHHFGSRHPRSHSGEDEDGAMAVLPSPTSLERSARLVFNVPPRGRCGALAGFFSAVLYESPTSPPTTLSTATPVGRTADMYSWFPAVFPLEPTQRAELYEVEKGATNPTGAVSIQVQLDRKVDSAQSKVWYEWRVFYGDVAEPLSTETMAAAAVVHNKAGWASPMLL